MNIAIYVFICYINCPQSFYFFSSFSIDEMIIVCIYLFVSVNFLGLNWYLLIFIYLYLYVFFFVFYLNVVFVVFVTAYSFCKWIQQHIPTSLSTVTEFNEIDTSQQSIFNVVLIQLTVKPFSIFILFPLCQLKCHSFQCLFTVWSFYCTEKLHKIEEARYHYTCVHVRHYLWHYRKLGQKQMER